MRKFAILLVFLLFAGLQVVLAQKTITGKVTSSEDGLGIPGATVLVKGTTNGVITDMDGAFKISLPANATKLVVSVIGMKALEVEIGTQTSFAIVLEPEAKNIEGVVITALGISREKKSLGYATQAVDGSEINNVKRDNFVNSLSGRVAGVQVKANGNMGGSSNVVIRGSRSLLGNNQALFVVDGIPVNNDNSNNTGQISGRNGYDYGNAASDINPNDIESMSVLKGAAATNLYGSRASNGVILITTKKGKKKTAETRAIGVNINSSITTGIVDKSTFPKYQQNYGAGYGTYYYGDDPYAGFEKYFDINGDGVLDLTVPTYEDASMGQKFDPSILVYQYDSYYPESPNYKKATPWVPAGDNGPISFFNNSINVSNSIDISGGGDNSTFRLGYTNLDQTGILPNSSLKRNNIILNGSYDVLKNLTISASASYTNTMGKGRNSTGYSDNIMSGFRQWMQTNVDYTMQKTLYDLTGRNLTWNPNSPEDLTVPAYWDNPYFLRYKNFETDRRDRVIGYMQADYKLTDYLSFMGRTSIDTYSELQEERKAVGSASGEFGVGRNESTAGYSRLTKTFTETNMDLLAKFNKNLTNDLSLSALLGTNIRRTTLDQVFASTDGGLFVPEIYSLANSKNTLPLPEERNNRIGVNGVYGGISLGFMNMLYLDASVRRDQSSTLPTANNAYFYPSISGSFVFSNLFEKTGAEWLQLGKIRLGYAEVGNDAPWGSVLDVYAQNPTFTSSYGSTAAYSVPSTKNNPDLKPERTKALEGGLEMTFMEQRLGFDVSVYDNRTVSQILPVTISSATGYSAKYVNAGEVQNKGFEIALFGTPVKMADFKWDINVNFSKNKNKVLSLEGDIKNLQIASLQGGLTINARVGQPYGSIQGTDYVIDSASGQRVVKANGYYLVSGTSDKLIGNINPDWNGGINNKFSYKGISFSFLIDIQHGGSVFSLDRYYGLATGLYAETDYINDLGNPVRDPLTTGPESGGLINPGVLADGTVNTKRIHGDDYRAFGYYSMPNSEFVYDASYVKLREVVLSYSLPKSLLAKSALRGATFSLVGSNVWILSKNLPDADPEASQSSGNVQGWQSGVMPSTRNFGFSVNLQF